MILLSMQRLAKEKLAIQRHAGILASLLVFFLVVGLFLSLFLSVYLFIYVQPVAGAVVASSGDFENVSWSGGKEEMTIYWGDRIEIGDYEFEATDFSAGDFSQIDSESEVWGLVSVYLNDSVVWRGTFGTGYKSMDNFSYNPYAYSSNESGYEFTMNTSAQYQDIFRINASKIVLGTYPSNPYIVFRVFFGPEKVAPITLAEWFNATFSLTKTVTSDSYISDPVYVKIVLENATQKYLESIVVSDTLPTEFVTDPDRDTAWNQTASTYTYAIRPLKPGTYTLPAANATAMVRGYSFNLTSDTPKIVVHGPYLELNKSIIAATPSNITVSIKATNIGDQSTFSYIMDALPEGATLTGGNLSSTAIIKPSGSAGSSFTLKYNITITPGETYSLPGARVWYQSSKQIDKYILYRPSAPPEVEKYINPKMYTAFATSNSIVVNPRDVAEALAKINATNDTEGWVEPVEGIGTVGDATAQEPVPEVVVAEEEISTFASIKAKIPGFGAIAFIFAFMLAGVLMTRLKRN